MASNTAKRYVWLINTLMQRKSLTFKEICCLWDKSSLNDGKALALRTFHQHREAIAELFGIEIVCDTNTYKYSIAQPEVLKTTLHSSGSSTRLPYRTPSRQGAI